MLRALLRKIQDSSPSRPLAGACCSGEACGDRAAVPHRYSSAMKKPIRCLLTFHDWRLMVNDEGQRYKTCTRCGAYRDFDPRPGG
jgi:hypothetical protein